MNRDQGRDLEKSKAKFGNHVVPLCDTNTLTAIEEGEKQLHKSVDLSCINRQTRTKTDT